MVAALLPNVDGEYDVKDVFGELVILIEDRSSVSGPGRRSLFDYSTAGGEFTWRQAAARRRPATIRGNYHARRAEHR